MVGINLDCFVLVVRQVDMSVLGICHADLGTRLIHVESFFLDDEVSII